MRTLEGVFVLLLAKVPDFYPLQNPFDFSLPIDKAIYFFLVGIAELMWSINAAALSLALLLRTLHFWLLGAFSNLIGVTIPSFTQLFIVALLFAVSLYGLSRIIAIFSPGWEPVDPGRAIMMAVLGFIYLSSASFVIGLVENVRTIVGSGTYSVVQPAITNVLGSISGLNGGGATIADNFTDSIIPSADCHPADYRCQNNLISGIDVAAIYLGVQQVADITMDKLPPGLVSGYPFAGYDGEAAEDSECCFSKAYDPAGFDSMDDNERSEQISYAYTGLGVLLKAPSVLNYAVAEEFVLMALSVVAFIIYVTLPIGFIFSPFRFTSGVLGGYVNRYIKLLIETVVTAIFLAFASSLVVAGTVLSMNAFMAVCLIAFCIALWRGLSAMKLATVAIDGAITPVTNLANEGSALSATDIKNVGVGTVVGGGMVAAGVATGNMAMAAAGGSKALGAVGGALSPGGKPPTSSMNTTQMMTMAGMVNAGKGKGGGDNPSGSKPSSDTVSETLSNGNIPSGSDVSSPGSLPPASSNTALPTPATAGNNGGNYGTQKKPMLLAHQSANGSQRLSGHEGGNTDSGTSIAIGANSDYVQRWAQQVNNTSATDHEGQIAREQMGHQLFGDVSSALVDVIDTGGVDDLMEACQIIEGMSEGFDNAGDALTYFQSGEAYQNASKMLPGDSAFQDQSLFNALADATLRPTKRVDHGGMMQAMRGVSGSDDYVADMAANLGNPAGFEQYTGILNSIAISADQAGALAIDPSGDGAQTYLETASEHYEAGQYDDGLAVLHQAAVNAGVDHGYADVLGDELITSTSLFSAHVQEIPQSVSFSAGDRDGYEQYQRTYVNRGADATHTSPVEVEGVPDDHRFEQRQPVSVAQPSQPSQLKKAQTQFLSLDDLMADPANQYGTVKK